MAEQTAIAKAYVQVIPSTKGLKGSLTGIMGSEGSSAGSIFGGNMVSTIRNTVAAAGLGTLIKEALSEGADKQQSLGGIETLFKDSADMVIQAAENAYRTAGMSANDYMETVTSFSASLLQGLSGDTQAAAEVADMALTDMSDNANKMGTSMELIQNAYQGFAKQNYTMLDNLKLGYGGTKTEMERLLADAQKLTGVKYDISNLADVYSAIHVIQEELKISGLSAEEAAEMVAAGLMTEQEAFEAMGTTAKEAATTFSGSLTAMKAAASNVLASLTLGEDVQPALTALGETVFTFVGGNLIPMVGNLMSSLPEVIRSSVSMAVQGMNIAAENADELLAQGIEFAVELGSAFVEGIPILIEAGWNMASSVGETIYDYLTGDALIDMAVAGKDLVLNVINGAIDRLPDVAGAAVDICAEFLASVAGELPEFLESGITLVCELAAGLIEAIPDAVEAAGEILVDIKDEFLEYDWLQLGKDVLQGIANGISNGVSAITSAAQDAARKALNAAKDFLGIHSPSRKFQEEVGAQIPPGIALGVEEHTDVVKAAMTELSDYATDSFNADFEIGSAAMEFDRSFAYHGNAEVSVLENLLREQRDVNLQSVERMIVLLEMLLEAVLGIEISGEAITRLVEDYRRKIAVAKGG